MEISKKALSAEFSPMRKFYKVSMEAERRGIRIHHLNIGQPDIPTPPEYFEAIRTASLPNDYYAPSQGMEELLDAVSDYYSSIGQAIDRNSILITTGGSEAIQIALECILNDGDELIIPEPYYPNYSTIAKAAGGKIVPMKTYIEDGFRYTDARRIEELITKRTKAMLITNPNNPTGTIANDREVLDILGVCKKHGLYLICDEVYREICFDDRKKSTSALRFRNFDEHIIIIDSLSKRFSACGARVGMLISRNVDIMKNAMKFAQARLSVSTLNQIGAAALFRNISKTYTDGIRDEYRRRRDAAIEELGKIEGVKSVSPNGAFYIMASLPVEDTDKLQEWLLASFDWEKESVMYSPGRCFYSTPNKGTDEIRIACVLEEKMMRRAIRVLGKGIEEYKSIN